jgi:phosphoglycolate phosphatase-like HAD superfamily hydrolase
VAYVGDSPEDVQMARASGVFALAVPGGFPNRHLLGASLPDHTAESIRSAALFLSDDAQLS